MKKATSDQKNNFFLKKTDKGFDLIPFDLPKFPDKIYGDLESVSKRVLTTFNERDKNLGVLFSGLKGNSKTLTSLKICADSKIQCIFITEPFTGDEFKGFLLSLTEECIVFIDEFEKIYDTNELQNEFLTILDGVLGGKKLFIFTSNSAQISTYLINRPNRIYYHYKYDNIEPDVLDQIIEEELKNKGWETDLRDILLILGSVSYDVILNLIDEVNRFDVSPKKLIKELNIQVEQRHFNVTLLINGERFMSNVEYNPLTMESFAISYKDKHGYYRFFSDYLKNYTMYTSKGNFVFENEKNKLIFSPYKPFKFEL